MEPTAPAPANTATLAKINLLNRRVQALTMFLKTGQLPVRSHGR